jgi:hypothetical protein
MRLEEDVIANLYDRDFHAWANEQARLLRAGMLAEADIDHIATEIERMGCSERRELVNRLVVLLLDLLKWEVQPNRRRHARRREPAPRSAANEDDP